MFAINRTTLGAITRFIGNFIWQKKIRVSFNVRRLKITMWSNIFCNSQKNLPNQFTIILIYTILQIQKKSRENIAWEFHYDFIKSLTSMWHHAVLSFLPFTFACIFREKKVIRHHLLFNSQYALATTVVHSGRYIIEFIIFNTRYVSFAI